MCAPRQSREAAVRFGDDNTQGILDSFGPSFEAFSFDEGQLQVLPSKNSIDQEPLD